MSRSGPYSRLDYDQDDDDPRYRATTPLDHTMDPRYQRATSPGGYQDEPYRPQRQDTAGYPDQQTRMPDWPDQATNRLSAQPTVS